MESSHYLMLAQAALALFAAFYLTRKIRGFIRATVVRFMPIRHRISDESFNMQTRISTMVAYLLGLLLSLLFYRGIDLVANEIVPGAVTRQEIITPVLPEPEPLQLLPAPEPLLEPKEKEAKPPIEDPEPTPVSEYETTPRDLPLPARETGVFYLQLYAFINVDRALIQQAVFSERLSYPVTVKKVDGTIGPYKVIVGPFASRREAMRLIREQRLQAMVVRADQLR